MAAPGLATRSESDEARREALRIVRLLREHGHEAYFAGGCVRDELLGMLPKDYDVATDATPTRVLELMPRAHEVGKAFGVMQVRTRRSGAPVLVTEVATFRKDSVYSDRRRPDAIEFATAIEDAFRRDFTINALFLDPMADARDVRLGGRVIDHVGGVADLRAGVVRAVGDPEARLAEDHLRGLRAVRFAARFGFEIEHATARAIAEHARELKGVSEERIGDEIRRMMAHPARGKAAALIETLGLARAIFGPEAAVADGSRSTLNALPEAATLASALGAWALDRAGAHDPAVVAIVADTTPRVWREALKLSNEESESFERALTGVAQVERLWHGAGMAAQKRMAASAWFADALVLIRARDTIRQGVGIAVEVLQRVAELEGTPGGIAPEAWVTGTDLIAAGLRPGPEFKRMLTLAYDAQLDGRARTREEALRLILPR